MNNGCESAAMVVMSVVFGFATGASGADDTAFLMVVRQYADTMIERGRDTYGPQKSGLLLSAMDRLAMKPLTTRPAPPGGVRREDRVGDAWLPLNGVNPQLDENLLRVLYALSDVTGDSKYGRVADQELEWFFNNTQSPVTGLFPWGEHLSWNVLTDKVSTGFGVAKEHEFSRPWVLWDRCYALAPDASKRFALGLWNHQIADHETGAFDRHAPYDEHGPRDGKDFARHAGFYIHTWGYAYKHTKDETFLKAIETLLARYERKGLKEDGTRVATLGPLDIYTASTMVPDPLAEKLRRFADAEDKLILESARNTHSKDGRLVYTPSWQAGYSSGVIASTAMYYLARYQQVPKNEYRDMIVAIADAYANTRPAEDVDVWPMSFGHVISAEVAACRLTGKRAYLEQARRFAKMAVELYWQDSPLPRAGLRIGHYESISGADTLALALLEVHAAVNDVSIPIPPNTIDR